MKLPEGPTLQKSLKKYLKKSINVAFIKESLDKIISDAKICCILMI